jgi:plastocyanin
MMTRTGKPAILATLCYLTILFATACGEDYGGQQPETMSPVETTTTTAERTTAPTAAPPPAQAGPPVITIFDFAFNEYNDVFAKPGAQVTVRNLDEDAHTVTSNTPAAFSVDLAPKAEATFTAPRQPGSYPFHCNHHSSMHGTLIVQ